MLSRGRTKALYDKISRVYDLLSEHTEGPVREAGLRMLAPQPGDKVLEIGFGTGHSLLAESKRVLKNGGRIVVVGMSKEGEHGLVHGAYEWTHRHFPNFVDCRPTFVSQIIAAAGFQVTEKQNLTDLGSGRNRARREAH